MTQTLEAMIAEKVEQAFRPIVGYVESLAKEVDIAHRLLLKYGESMSENQFAKEFHVGTHMVKKLIKNNHLTILPHIEKISTQSVIDYAKDESRIYKNVAGRSKREVSSGS